MGYIFFMASVQMSFISLVVDLLPIVSYQELYFQIPSPFFYHPVISKSKLESFNKTNFIYFILASFREIQYTITRKCNYDKIIHAP